MVGEKVVSLIVGDVVTGLDINTSTIPSNTSVRKITTFNIQDNILYCSGTSVNLNEVYILV